MEAACHQPSRHLTALAGGRPITLDDVAARWPDSIGDGKREWLDVFHGADCDERAHMLSVRPRGLPDARWNAYLGALAEHMAQWGRITPPEWCFEDERTLHRAWFPGGTESMKAYCLVHSPAAFRARMIFIDGSPASRARYGLPDKLPGQTMSWADYNKEREAHP